MRAMKTSEGFLKYDKMTAREFLWEFINYAVGKGYGSAYDMKDCVDGFLAEFHETYVPIKRWIVKGETVWTCHHGVKHPNELDEP